MIELSGSKVTTARLKHPAQVAGMRLPAHWIFPAHRVGRGPVKSPKFMDFKARTGSNFLGQDKRTGTFQAQVIDGAKLF
jgi:hypothetical protein